MSKKKSKKNLSQTEGYVKVIRGQPTKKRVSLWEGPSGEGPNGGVTQSLLSRFVVCRERFRIHAVEGLRQSPTFSHRLEYGQMWHVCEEALAKHNSWKDPLHDYCLQLGKTYRTQQEQVLHWENVCYTQFPHYVAWWAKHPDVRSRTPLMQEQVFDAPYELPSGRAVRMRGKWDGVDLIGKDKDARVYLFETKTKGDIDEGQMRKQLQFDLQTMFYLIALDAVESQADGRDDVQTILGGKQLAGVRYNVIRRPLAGGKNSIRKKEPTKTNPRGESDEEFYERLSGLIAEDPAWYFMRWRVEVTRQDVERFKRKCLDPWLEMLWDWWEDEAGDPLIPPAERTTHARTPFGIYNVLAEGGSTDLDEYLATGSTVGLVEADALFGELE